MRLSKNSIMFLLFLISIVVLLMSCHTEESPTGYLGITVRPHEKGIQICNIIGGGPATYTGLRVGDIIIEYIGQPFTNVNDFILAVGDTKVGTTAKILVYREGGCYEDKIDCLIMFVISNYE